MLLPCRQPNAKVHIHLTEEVREVDVGVLVSCFSHFRTSLSTFKKGNVIAVLCSVLLNHSISVRLLSNINKAKSRMLINANHPYINNDLVITCAFRNCVTKILRPDICCFFCASIIDVFVLMNLVASKELWPNYIVSNKILLSECTHFHVQMNGFIKMDVSTLIKCNR